MNERPLQSLKPSEAASPRIRSLSSLPVFLTLAGKRAAVTGNSAAAAWKAELLAAAGAKVEIWAPEPGPEITTLCNRKSEAGAFRLREAIWSPGDLKGVAIAVCDAGSDDEASTFAEAARAAGAMYNVIDRPDHCHFQFGSIVNRSSIVVGISTHGAAPILGQAIRRRIETLLAPELSAWADLARRLRRRVMERLRSGTERRAFWERLVERAFHNEPVPDEDEAAFAEMSNVRTPEGRVTLVGAGPGEAGYLTIQAVRALQAADVILFDDLVSDDVLEMARREAKRILVGKRAGRPSCRQEDINGLMIALARQGRHVVRLKSGDPAIFGRGGEEAEALDAAGVSVAMVPGITAASAMAARLGLSLTHRDHAHGVRFVTGHHKRGRDPIEPDRKPFLNPSETTVFYMGGKAAADIAHRAIAGGQVPSTPVVAMRSISRPEETRWSGSLADLAAGQMPAGDGPVLIGIGAVFKLASVQASRRTIAA